VLIVLDTNVFWPDVHAAKAWLSTILRGAKAGDFELVVPETVIRELTRQYPERLLEAIEDANAAIGRVSKELRRMDVETPDRIVVDQLERVGRYETELRARLLDSGCRIEPDPREIGRLVDWAVDKRMPFKASGEGLPDAVIWLTTLTLAKDSDEVLLVSNNKDDFGDGAEETSLSRELVGDLEEDGLPGDRVRLITDTRALAEKIVAPMAEAEARAYRLVSDPELSSKIGDAVREAFVYSPISQDDLRLGVDLDNDPQPIALDVDSMEVESVRQTEDELFLRIEAICDLHLDMAVYKADWAIADDDSPVATAGEINDHYYEAEAEITARLTIDLNSDPRAEKVEVESLVAAERLSDEELVERRLERIGTDPLFEAIRDPSGGEMSVDGYVPDALVESGVDEATASDLIPSAVEVVSVEEHSGEGVRCTLEVVCEADVSWLVAAPTGFDSENNRGLSENPDDGGWIADVDYRAPLVLRLQATLNSRDEWVDLEPEELSLTSAERDRRWERIRDAEAELLDRFAEARERLRQKRKGGRPQGGATTADSEDAS
jgi:predicted nucleic acid-binding protein